MEPDATTAPDHQRGGSASTPAVLAAAGATALGATLLVLGQAIGLVGMIAGYALLLTFHPKLAVAVIVASVPVATIGWGASLATIDGRTLDARLVLTFGIAALAGGRAVVDLVARRPDRLEIGMGVFLAYIVIIGLVQSESVYVWAPYVARWTSYFAMFVIARRAFSGAPDVTWIAGAALGGFLIVTLGGLLEFGTGAGRLMNEAVRATAPGDGGPVALAFAAQFVAITACYFPTSGSRAAGAVRWIVVVIGGLAIVASATRTVLITAWAALAVPALIARRWRTVLIVSLFVGTGLVARPDFIGRFLDMTGVDPPPAPTHGGELPPDGETDERVDASLNFRLFVWGELLDRWTEEPLIGIGPGMTAEAIAEVSPASRIPPHNDYIGVLSELGAVGLIGFVGLQLGVGWQLVFRQFTLLRRRIIENDPRILAATLFVAFNVLGALNNPMYYLDIQLGVWSIVGAALAVTTSEGAAIRRRA